MSRLPIYDALTAYVARKQVHFDVPGHKRNPKTKRMKEFMDKRLIDLDVSSAKPLDLIGNPKGIIREASQLMAKAYSSEDAFLMVNGTTAAVQNMILAAVNPGEKIIMPRNIHKSAMNALILSGAVPVYLKPVLDENLGIAHGVTLESVREAIENNRDAKAVLLMNPTYYGVSSDLFEIVNLVHDNHMLLLCDEAHGAHFYFNDKLPAGGMTLGADMSSVSLHKTGGSLTQSSVLLAHRRYLDTHLVNRAVALTQTTSPSYLLLSSLDVTRQMLEEHGKELLDEALALADYARTRINALDGYYCPGKELIGQPGVHDLDLTKLTIKVSDLGLSGNQVYDLLRDQYGIQVELGDVHIILAVVSVGDTLEGVDALIAALADIAKNHRTDKRITAGFHWSRPVMVISPRAAYYAKKRPVDLADAAGDIAGESVMAYPPGIPIVAPGEKITRDMLEYIEFLKSQDCVLSGADDPTLQTILVLGS